MYPGNYQACTSTCIFKFGVPHENASSHVTVGHQYFLYMEIVSGRSIVSLLPILYVYCYDSIEVLAVSLFLNLGFFSLFYLEVGVRSNDLFP